MVAALSKLERETLKSLYRLSRDHHDHLRRPGRGGRAIRRHRAVERFLTDMHQLPQEHQKIAHDIDVKKERSPC